MCCARKMSAHKGPACQRSGEGGHVASFVTQTRRLSTPSSRLLPPLLAFVFWDLMSVSDFHAPGSSIFNPSYVDFDGKFQM